MGWLFGWNNRRDLIHHLTRSEERVKTLKHCVRGNNLWVVHSYENKHGRLTKFIVLYMLSKSDGQWGYKDIDECCGPLYYSCPVSYLEMCTAPEHKFAYDWRQKIYKLDAIKKRLRKNIGSVVTILGRNLIIQRVLKNQLITKSVDSNTTHYVPESHYVDINFIGG